MILSHKLVYPEPRRSSSIAHNNSHVPVVRPTSFQSLTDCLKLNHPMRIVHPEGSEGSLCLFSINYQRLTRCLKFATLSEPVYFQSLPTVKFCNSFLLITMQQWGVWGGQPLHDLKYYFNSIAAFSAEEFRHGNQAQPFQGERTRSHSLLKGEYANQFASLYLESVVTSD